MSIGHGPKIVTRGLTFAFDMNYNDRWISKSYGGKPTSNYAWKQSSVPQATYTSYSATASGTWNAKHPNAIRAYNEAGTDITGYVNTGVTDWTNTYHAIWEFDSELGKPVVVMRDIGNGAWMAKNWNTGYTYTSMGLTNGDTYTISWLQWVDDIAKSANAGLYGTNTSGTNGFHDGLSNAQSTSYNTKPYTWQRVYATFTVAASNNTGTTRSCYMYGHYIKRATTKIANVQIEPSVPSTFITGSSLANATRSSTGVLTDWTGNHTITANSLTYNSDGTFSFNGTSNYITVGSSSDWAFGGNGTIEQWVYPTNSTGNDRLWCVNNNSSSIDAYLNGSSYNLYYHGGIVNGGTLTQNSWNHVCVTYTNGTIQAYVNGVAASMSGTTTGYNITNSAQLIIGEYQNLGGYKIYGKIPTMKVYNRALTATEVAQNFNALKGRFGI